MGRHAQQASKFRAIQVVFRRALGHVPKRIPERHQPVDLEIEIVGTGLKGGARQVGTAILAEHALDLVKAEPCRLAERYQAPAWVSGFDPVLASQPAPSQRSISPISS